MAYDEVLASRLRTLLEGEPGLTEQKMFGGLGFMLDGHMAVAVSGQGGLMVRVDPVTTEELVAHDGVARMEMGGRTMGGWLLVDDDVVATDDDLADWAGHGVRYVRTLPPKQR